MYLSVALQGHLTSAWPWLERHPDRVQAGHELAVVAEHLQGAGPHARHDLHVDRDVGRVGHLDADVADVRSERSHRERHDVHRAALHRTLEEALQDVAHLARVAPVVRRTGVVLVLRADERAVLDARDVARVRRRVVTVRSLGRREPGEGAGVDEELTQFVVLLVRSVAPVDTIGGCEPRNLFHPRDEFLVSGRVRHVGFLRSN